MNRQRKWSKWETWATGPQARRSASFRPDAMSKPGKIMPAGAVNMIGKVLGDATQFKKVMNESQVTLAAV